MSASGLISGLRAAAPRGPFYPYSRRRSTAPIECRLSTRRLPQRYLPQYTDKGELLLRAETVRPHVRPELLESLEPEFRGVVLAVQRVPHPPFMAHEVGRATLRWAPMPIGHGNHDPRAAATGVALSETVGEAGSNSGVVSAVEKLT